MNFEKDQNFSDTKWKVRLMIIPQQQFSLGKPVKLQVIPLRGLVGELCGLETKVVCKLGEGELGKG